mmetsp:Transcript_42659/g.121617  ORF Transcript_42659/g.121617 Transcript_42659/m.121617 type:complete len:539 (-) Transcript_42659:143-1759(-)
MPILWASGLALWEEQGHQAQLLLNLWADEVARNHSIITGVLEHTPSPPACEGTRRWIPAVSAACLTPAPAHGSSVLAAESHNSTTCAVAECRVVLHAAASDVSLYSGSYGEEQSWGGSSGSHIGTSHAPRLLCDPTGQHPEEAAGSPTLSNADGSAASCLAWPPTVPARSPHPRATTRGDGSREPWQACPAEACGTEPALAFYEAPHWRTPDLADERDWPQGGSAGGSSGSPASTSPGRDNLHVNAAEADLREQAAGEHPPAEADLASSIERTNAGHLQEQVPVVVFNMHRLLGEISCPALQRSTSCPGSARPRQARSRPGLRHAERTKALRTLLEGRPCTSSLHQLAEELLFESLPRGNVAELAVTPTGNEHSRHRFLGTLRAEEGRWSRVRVAWHLPGTPAAARSIAERGICCDGEHCSRGRYGRGGYVALSAAKANAYAGLRGEGDTRCLFLVLALPEADTVRGERGVRPARTASDLPSNPTEYCFVDPSRLHCACLITYRWVPTGRRDKVATAGAAVSHVVPRRLLAAAAAAGA